MSPDLHDLIGDEGTPEELSRLRQVHNMLVAAGPPPELSPRLADVPKTTVRTGWLPKRRKEVAFVVAAGVAAAAFGVGFLVGNRGSNDFPSNRSAIQMHPTSHSSTARMSILVGERDSVGNWPLLVHAIGLKQLPKGEWYELYLTRNGKITAWCGAFSVEKDGRTSVRFSVPYKLKGNVGWVVTTSQNRHNPPVLLTT
jgi:hypothetical protein